jgi:hypothetical protein
MAKKEEKRPDTPLADTPSAKKITNLSDALRDIEVNSSKRRQESYAAKAASNEIRRKKMESRSTSRGSSLQGLEVSFGKKIITK